MSTTGGRCAGSSAAGSIRASRRWRTAFSGVSITAGLTLAANIAAILYRAYWLP